MRALLLAAGMGKRLRPVTNRVPKCLVPILGRPLLDYWLDLTLGQSIERVLVNTHYLAELVQRHLESNPWRDRVEIVHETELLGTGGTLLANRTFFHDEAFIVAHADNLVRFSLAEFQAAHRGRPEGVIATMMTFDTDSPERCGIVETDGQGVVRAFHEKVPNPPGIRANGAIYLFEPTLFDLLEDLGKAVIDLSTEVLPNLLGRMQTFHNTDYLRDIGTVESLHKAEGEYARLIEHRGP